MRRAFASIILSVSLALGPSLPAAAEPVDLLLVLAADVSRSVDAGKFQLQREGYAAAFSDPRVVDAIRSGARGRIAVAFVEWSGVASQRLMVDWMSISDAETGREFGTRVLETPRPFAERTSISAAIDFSILQFAHAPFEASRRTIDVSGDGTNNSGRDVRGARDDALAQNVTINGLVILSEQPLSWNPEHTHPPGGLAAYYRENVVGGPGGFVMVAEDFKSFGNAIINKLVAEIAQCGPGRYAFRARGDSVSLNLQ